MIRSRRRRLARALHAVLGAALAAGSAAATAASSLAQTPGAPAITYDGCLDIRGVRVASVADSTVLDVAKAGLTREGAPIILYNPQVLAFFRPQTRLFWYAHECGHHALGHAFVGNPLSREQEADCFGIRALFEAGLLGPADLAVIQDDLARVGPGDWTHLPGPQRAVNLEACLRLPALHAPRLVPFCRTPAGVCALREALPEGTRCYCPTAGGTALGTAGE